VATLERQPGRGEELAVADRPTARRSGVDVIGVEPGGECLGFVSLVADGVPPSVFLAGDGVEAVVGHDVEAVLALHDVGHADEIGHFDANPKRRALGTGRGGASPATIAS